MAVILSSPGKGPIGGHKQGLETGSFPPAGLGAVEGTLGSTEGPVPAPCRSPMHPSALPREPAPSLQEEQAGRDGDTQILGGMQ